METLITPRKMLSQILKRAFRDIAVYLPGKFLPALAAIVAVPIIARLFSPAEYGVLTIVNTSAAAGGIAVGSWLRGSVTRFLPYYRQHEQLQRFYASLIVAFALSLFSIGVIGSGVFLVARGILDPSIQKLLPLVSATVAVSSLFTILQSIFRVSQYSGLFIISELARAYGGLALGVTLVVFGQMRIEGIIWGNIVVLSLVSLFGCLWLTRQGIRIGSQDVSLSTIREFATYGLPAGVAAIGTWILSLSDRYIIEHYRGSVEVGLYSIGYSLADKSVNLVVASLMLAISPVLVNTWESEDRGHIVDLLAQLTRPMVILIVPLVVGLTIFSRSLFEVLTSPSYLAGAPVLGWVSLGSFLYGLSLLAYTGLILGKRTVVIARNWLLAGGVNVLLNVLLVPYWGYMAAAVNSAVSYGILLILNCTSATKFLPWLFPWRSLRNSSVATIVMAIALAVWQSTVKINVVTLVVGVVVGCVVYFGSLVLLRELDAQEEAFLIRLWRSAWTHLRR